MKKSRIELIQALAYCVESLSTASKGDASGAIRSALECDSKVWDYLDASTREILTEGMGYVDPKTDASVMQ